MRVLFFIWCLGFLTNGYAVSLSGIVRDKADGKSIPGATVIFPDLNKGAITDKEGNFKFKSLPSGYYKIQVSFIGYATIIKSFHLKNPHEFIEIHIEKSVLSLNEVVISAGSASKKEAIPYKIETINIQEISTSGETNLMSSLTAVSGVNQISYGPGISKPVIRGLSFSRILTVYQGSRFENQQWGEDHGLGLNDPGIERVEIIKGPASLLYGSGALGGVINLIDETHAPAGITKGDYDIQLHTNTMGVKTGAGVLSSNHKSLSWGVRGAFTSHSDYIDGNTRTIGNSRFNNQVFRSFAAINKNWGSTKLTYTLSRQRLGIIEEDELTESLATFRSDKKMQLPFQNVEDHLISSRTIIPLNKGLLKVNLAHHSNLRKEIEKDFNIPDLGLKLSTSTWDVKYVLPLNEQTEYTVGMQGFFQKNQNMANAQEILLPDAVLNDVSTFVMLSKGNENFNFQTGIRYDHRLITADARSLEGFVLPGNPEDKILSKGFNGFSGSMGATYNATDKISIKATLANGFRSPDLSELFSNGQHPGTNRFERGNVSFRRENNYQTDISAQYKSKDFSIEIAAFGNYIRNFIFFTPTNERKDELVVWQFVQDDVIMKGGEVGGSYHPKDMNFLKINSNMAYVHAVRLSDGSAVPQIPPLTFNHSILVQLNDKKEKEQSVILKVRQVFSQARTGHDELSTAGYTIISAGYNQNFTFQKLRCESGLMVNNLTNVSYFDHLAVTRQFGIFNPGRNIVLTLKAHF
jgi:iron complex outermembrane recepter protein